MIREVQLVAPDSISYFVLCNIKLKSAACIIGSPCKPEGLEKCGISPCTSGIDGCDSLSRLALVAAVMKNHLTRQIGGSVQWDRLTRFSGWLLIADIKALMRRYGRFSCL
jgi:hypothetical protein